MSQHDSIRLSHPTWVRLITFLGLPLMGLGSVYLLGYFVFVVDNHELLAVSAFLLLGGFPLYMTIISLRVLPFLNSELVLSENGIEVCNKNRPPDFFPWHLVGEVKHYATSSVVDVYSRDGARIFAVFENIRSFRELTFFLDAYTESNLSGAKDYTQ